MVLKSYQNPILAGFSYNITHVFRWYPRSTPNLESRSLVCIHFRHSPRKTLSRTQWPVRLSCSLVEPDLLNMVFFVTFWWDETLQSRDLKSLYVPKSWRKYIIWMLHPTSSLHPTKLSTVVSADDSKWGALVEHFQIFKGLVCTGDISIEAHIRTICFFLCLYISCSSRFNPNNDGYLAHDLPRVGKDTQKKHRGWVSHDHPKSIHVRNDSSYNFNQPTIILIESKIISWKKHDNSLVIWHSYWKWRI